MTDHVINCVGFALDPGGGVKEVPGGRKVRQSRRRP
jgi:hypothetical protein